MLRRPSSALLSQLIQLASAASSRARGAGWGVVGKGGALLRRGGGGCIWETFYHFCDGLKIGAFPQERRESLEQEEPLFCAYASAYTAEASH